MKCRSTIVKKSTTEKFTLQITKNKQRKKPDVNTNVEQHKCIFIYNPNIVTLVFTKLGVSVIF